MEMIKTKSRIKQLFCKHNFVKARAVPNPKQPFVALNGERTYTVCEKCGKVKDSVFYEYEGMGYK